MPFNQSEVRRIDFLDGLRGVAAMMVFMNHLLLSFSPSIASTPVAAAVQSVAKVVPVMAAPHAQPIYKSLLSSLSASPLAVFCCGNFAVCIFFVLSGFVLSDFCNKSRLSFPAQCARRYCRLVAPMVLTSTLAWLLLHFGLYRNQLAAQEVTHSAWLSSWYNFDSHFFQMVKETLYEVFIVGEAKYNCNLWTMKIELIGSIYVFALFTLLKNRYWRLFAILACTLINYEGYYVLFSWGVLLYDFHYEMAAMLRRLLPSTKKLTSALMAGFLLAMYLGGFPMSPAKQLSPWYFGMAAWLDPVHWHTIGAMLLVFVLLQSQLLQIVFQLKLAKFFGKISFVLYLIHVPVICSLTAWLILANQTLPYYQMMLISISVTMVAVIALSHGLHRYCDQYTTQLSRRIGIWVDQGLLRRSSAPIAVSARISS